MRGFVAIDVGDVVGAEAARVVQTISGKIEAVKTPPKIAWVKPDALHLTLRFIGEVADEIVPALCERLAPPIAVAPFGVEWRGLGMFPSARQPRALWLGVVAVAAAPDGGSREDGRRRRRLAEDPAGAGRAERPFTWRPRHALPPSLVATKPTLYWTDERPSGGKHSIGLERPTTVDLLPAILLGYAIGSVPIGYLVAQGASGVDLRRVGSGNVGATNVYRTGGPRMGVVVMIADAAKGVGAVLLSGGGPATVAAGVAAVVGHIYPVWLGFRGGKGVATASGVFGVLAPWPTLLAAAAFGVTVARTRLVSLGSIVAAVLLPVLAWSTPGPRTVDVGATVVAVLILFRHRGNVGRLWSRTERALPPSRRARRRTSGT